METFNFNYHTITHNYPKGDSFKFGKGYEFSAAPQLPIQRKFRLYFGSISWFKKDGVWDPTVEPTNNALALIQFYERHYTYKKFIYPHELYGNLTVKFATDSPFEVPKSLKGGSGVTEEFDLTFVEQPL